ncbi:hypothetical protein D9619_002276 [Psilocybe cf. subviscida]|uniref:Uncharacterized protein n=1 Tax=Psilocybe cf. subviscida TaxID=2480587 RepID=A0A8H5BH84_9AGAR|nr:hypothetical protein D9619_002276 [Psilocybe cf. subviscida]
MEQDGKLDPAAKTSNTDPSTRTIMLTLCYRHAAIPFPPSYEAARLEALNTFAAYIPADTEAVSLRQALQRRNGEHVWSIIREDSWDTILKDEGEELGVFLPDVPPEAVGYEYKKPPKRLVEFHFVFINSSASAPDVLTVVHCFRNCELYAMEVGKRQDDSFFYKLSFDKRMIGSEAERKAYREQKSEGVSTGKVWHLLDAELFDFLVGLHPEPLQIRVEYVVC